MLSQVRSAVDDCEMGWEALCASGGETLEHRGLLCPVTSTWESQVCVDWLWDLCDVSQSPLKVCCRPKTASLEWAFILPPPY